jgi:acylphosphatase
VTGLVQGVGFRYRTREAAQQLGVLGWVRNQSDGSVEVLAQGAAGAIENFARFLETGPRHARVDSVLWSESPSDPTLSRFEIRS